MDSSKGDACSMKSYEEMKAQNVSTFEKPLILVPLSNLAVEY